MSVPEHLQDSQKLISDKGFAIGSTWYHGTSSALVGSITQNGLKRSGDKALNQAAKQTMATIGNDYTESIEPVFLTQSKELAYFWAQQTVHERSMCFETDELPVVLAVNLPAELASDLKTDVGAASLLMTQQGEAYMAFVVSLYEKAGVKVPDVDLMNADRMAYLNQLGMAYYNKDISAEYIEQLK
ncbi:MAG: hypothetical protein ACJAZB_001267 [Psychrosphaera sp.]|jgi:hypothetical protein